MSGAHLTIIKRKTMECKGKALSVNVSVGHSVVIKRNINDRKRLKP